MKSEEVQLWLILFTFLGHTSRSSEITIVKSQFLASVIEAASSQTVHLLNRTEMNISRPVRLIESIPGEALSSFHVVETSSQVYLTFRNVTANLQRFSNCVLLLSDDIAVNVTFVNRPSSDYYAGLAHRPEADLDDDEDDFSASQHIRIHVEYIFKLSNRSRFGLIKDDTPVNGIICIVRLSSTDFNQTDLDLIDIHIGSDYFQVKRFQKQLYMVQLVKTREVFRIDRLFEVNVEAFLHSSKIRLARSRVRFLVVRAQEMDIRLDRHDKADLELDVLEDDGRVWRPTSYGGRFLTAIKPYLTRSIFLDDSDMENYVEENVRFRIAASNFPQPLIEIDSEKGILSVCANTSLDREAIVAVLRSEAAKLWFNISVSDQRKLFRPNSVLVYINVLDINDNEPEYKNSVVNIALDLNTIHTTHESAYIDSKHYFLIFNQTAQDADLAENGSLSYFLHSVRADHVRFTSLAKFFVPSRTGQLWVSLEAFFLMQNSPRSVFFYHVRVGCKDQRGLFTLADVHVRMNLSTVDEYRSAMTRHIGLIEQRCFYFELDVDQVIQAGQVRLGHVPIKLADSTIVELQPFEINDEFGRFFNLTIARDGLVRILLNQHYYQNRARLRTINHLMSVFSFVTTRNEVKSVTIYLKFIGKESVWFKNSLYEIKVKENEVSKEAIGRLETSCDEVSADDLRVISNQNSQFNVNRLLKVMGSSANRSIIEVYQLTALDFEASEVYELWVVAKCVVNASAALISTRLRVLITDRNDHAPHIVHPVGGVNQTFPFTVPYSKLDDYALLQLRAVDFDTSDRSASVKFTIIDNQLVKSNQHWCTELNNLTIYLDEVSGWLYVDRSGGGESFRSRSWCDIEFRLRAVAVNYLTDENEISEPIEFGLSLRILSNEAKSTSASFTWIVRQRPSWRAQPVASYTGDESDLADYVQIDRCWANQERRPLGHDEFYLSLSWPNLYFFERQTLDDVSRIECRLVDLRPLNTSGGGSLRRAASWLVLEMLTGSSELPQTLDSSAVYVELDKSELLRDNSPLTRFDHLSLIENDLDDLMLVYKFSDTNDNFISSTFKLDPFTGELRTMSLNSESRDLLKTANLLYMDVDILILKVEQTSHRLLKKYLFSVYINITDAASNSSVSSLARLLDVYADKLNEKIFRKTVNHLPDDRHLRIVQLNATSLTFHIDLAEQIDLNSPVSKPVYPSPFSYVSSGAYLAFDLDALPARVHNGPLVYFLRLRVCLQQAAVENDQIFSRRCKVAEFNVQLDFKLSQDELKFRSDKFSFTYFSVNRLYFDADLVPIEPTKPLLDLTSLITDSHLLDIGAMLRSAAVSFRLGPGHDFYLDERTGLVYAPRMFDVQQSKDYSVDVFLRQTNVELKSKLIVRFKRIETNVTVSVQIDRDRPKPDWLNVFKLEMFDRLNSETFKSLQIETRCIHMEQHTCLGLFKFNKLTGALQMQPVKLFNSPTGLLLLTTHRSIRIQLGLGLTRRLFEIDLNIEVNSRQTEAEEPLGDQMSRVYLINTTEPGLQVSLIERAVLENSSRVEVVRVKNMLTNNQVLALGYRVSLSDDEREYCLQLDDALSLELNQLYAFDLIVRDDSLTNSVTPSTTALYFIRFNPYLSDSAAVHTVKFYTHINAEHTVRFNLSKIEADYSSEPMVEADHAEFHQKIVLINRVVSNRLDVRSLHRRFKLDDANTLLFFDSSQIDIDLFGDFIQISLFKFIADKISLKVIRIVEYQINIETFADWQKPRPINIPSYYRLIKLAKSELFNELDTKSIRMGYNYLILDLGSEYPNSNIERYALDYKMSGDVPFEIEKYSGRLYYLPSEDQTEFEMRNGEKLFRLSVQLTDASDKSVSFFIDVRLVDDDELFYTDGLTNELYIESAMKKDTLVGQVNVTKAFVDNPNTNLTYFVEFLSNNFAWFQFEILSTNDQENLFRLDRTTGMLLSNKPVSDFGDEIKKLEVQVKGKVGERACYFLVDVFVFFTRRIERVTTAASSSGHIRFESSELNASLVIRRDEQIEYFEPVQASRLRVSNELAVDLRSIRYKLVRNYEERCEISWLQANLTCRPADAIDIDNEAFSIVLAAYDLDRKDQFDLLKINVNIKYDRTKTKQVSQVRASEVSTNEETPTLTLKLNTPLRIGDCFVRLFDLLEANTTLIRDRTGTHLRVYLLDEENLTNASSNGLISDYFRLNSLSGELILKNVLLEPRLQQLFKLVQDGGVQLLRIEIEADETCLLAGRQQPDDPGHDVSIELSLRYMLLKTKQSIKLARIFNFDPAYDYFIELVSLNKSMSESSGLVLATSVQLVKNIYSLVHIDADYLILNSDKLLERNLLQFDFTVLKLTPSPSANVLDRIECRINYKLVVSFDDNLDNMADFMGYSRLDVEIYLDSSAGMPRVGDVLFDLNRTLLNGALNSVGHHLSLELSESNLPFAIDLSTGNLVVSHQVAAGNRSFKFALSLTDRFLVHFLVHTHRSSRVEFDVNKGLSEVQKLRVAKNCRNNHFIGSLNNLPSLEDIQFQFDLIDESSWIRVNASTGHVFCSQSSSPPDLELLEVQVNWMRKNGSPTSFFKTILVYVERYESSVAVDYSDEPNEKLVFELRVDAQEPLVDVWTIPEIISTKYETCLIIAGNRESRFRLKAGLLAYQQSEPTGDSDYELLLRCFSSKLAEIDIQLNIRIVRSTAHSHLITMKSVHEIDLNIDGFRENRTLLRLDPNRTMHVRFELMAPKSGLARFYASLLKIDAETGEIRADLTNFNKYLQQCEFDSAGKRSRLSILVPVKIYNTTIHATTLVKLTPNCERTNLNLRFEKPYYIIWLESHELKPGTLLDVLRVADDELTTTYSVLYRLCGPLLGNQQSGDDEIDLFWLRLDERTGQLTLNSYEIPPLLDDKIDVRVCAVLNASGRQMRTPISIETELSVRVKWRSPSIGPLSRPRTDTDIDLALSLHKLIASSKQHVKIFKLSVENTNVSLLTSSVDLFDIVNDWITLRRDAITLTTQTHYLHIHSGPIMKKQMEAINVKLKFTLNCPIETNVDLYVPTVTKIGSKLFDVKRLLCGADEYKFVIMEQIGGSLCNECVFYNQLDGHLYLSKEVNYMNSLLEYAFKLTSADSDLILATLRLIFYQDGGDFSHEAKRRTASEILVSVYTKIGSVLYDSKADSFSSKDSTYFELHDGKLVLAKNLTQLADWKTREQIMVTLNGQDLDVLIYLIENLKPKFTQSVYYFKLNGKLDEVMTVNKRLIGILYLSPPRTSANVKLLAIEWTRVKRTKCGEGNSGSDQSGLFWTESGNGHVILWTNLGALVEQNCELFELIMEAGVESVRESAQVRVYVQLANLVGLKFARTLSAFRNGVTHFFKIPNETTVSVYELFGLRRDQAELRAPVSNMFAFDPISGVLTLSSTPKSVPQMTELDIVATYTQAFAAKLRLNVHVVDNEMNHSSVYYFDRSVYKVNLAVSQVCSQGVYQTNNSIVFDAKSHLFDYSRRELVDKDDWSTSGITISSYDFPSGNKFIVLDDLDGVVRLNETILSNYRLFLNTTIRFQVDACSSSANQCTTAIIEFTFQTSRLSLQIDYFKEFFTGYSFNDSIKLRKFGFDGGYSIYKSQNELLTIDYSTGSISTLDDRAFVIVYNETYPIRYQPPVQLSREVNVTYQDNELVSIEFVFKPKFSMFAIFMLNLGGRFNSGQECEFWSEKHIDGVKLNANCDMFVKPRANSSLVHFQVRLWDRLCRERSRLLNVQLNATSAGPDDADDGEFVPFYELTTEKTTMTRSNKRWIRRQLKSFGESIFNSIKFNKLSYVIYAPDQFNLTDERYATFRLAFRSLASRAQSNLLFFSRLNVGKKRTAAFYLSLHMFDTGIEVRHNLSAKFGGPLKIDYPLFPSVWHFVQVQVTEKDLTVEIRQLKFGAKDGNASSRTKKIRLKNMSFAQQLLVNELYIGGIDRAFSNTSGVEEPLFADEVEIADMRLNSHELFDADTMRTRQRRVLLDEDASSKTCAAQYECFRPVRLINNVNFTLEMRMKSTYKGFLLLHSSSLPNNLTVIFSVDCETPRSSSVLTLVRSKRSLIVLNLHQERIELRRFNRILASIHLNLSKSLESNTLSLISTNYTTKLILNNSTIEFQVDFEELFTSDLLKVESTDSIRNASVCLQAVIINNDRLAISRGQSKFYTTELFTNNERQLKRQETCSPVRFEVPFLSGGELAEKNFNLITELSEEELERAPSTIIITVVISSVIAFVAMLSILANIYLRNVRTGRELTKSRARVASLRMNSQQEFEISLNLSQQSPFSSEVCSLSTNHSHTFNPFGGGGRSTVPGKPVETRSSDECLLNCLSLNARALPPPSSDYFEYDAFKMGELTPHAEFIFKKVNINKLSSQASASNSGEANSESIAASTLTFERHDLDKMRHMLNWEPSYSQYEDVFDEMQRYVNRKHVCNRCEQHIDLELNNRNNVETFSNGSILCTNLTSCSNLHSDYDRHTFV